MSRSAPTAGLMTLGYRISSQAEARTSAAHVAAGIAISMDGRGRWMDNVFIERLWRSLKHEDIYLKGYADGGEARAGIAAWMEFHNHGRLHQRSAIKRRWRSGERHG